MRFLFLSLVLLFFVSCRFSESDVRVYALSMQYACDCDPEYRIFRVENKDEKNPLKNRQDIDLNNEKDKALDEEIYQVLHIRDSGDSSISSDSKYSLIGWDINLEFKDTQSESKFYKDEGMVPICNIYYFEGKLHRTMFDKLILKVKDYKILSKSPSCSKK